MMCSNWRALAGCLIALCAAQTGAAKTAVPDHYVDEKTRDIVGGRKVLIVIAQKELLLGVDTWQLGTAVENARIYLVREPAASMLGALRAHDFDSQIRQSLSTVVENTPWLHAQDIELTREDSNESREAALDASNTRQMLVLRVRYSTDQRHAAVMVGVEATLLVRQIPKGQRSRARLKRDYIPYQQRIRSVVQLPGTGNTSQQNIDRWAADGAARTREALEIGLRQVSRLLAQNLRQDRQAADAWRDRNNRATVERSSMLGWVVGPIDAGTLFVEARAGSLNYLQTLAP